MASIFDQARQLADRLRQGAVNAVRPPIASPIPRYTNPTQTLSYKANEVKRAVLQPFARAQSFVQSAQPTRIVPQIQAPQTRYRGLNTAGRIGTGLVNIGGDIVNTAVGRGVVDPALDIGRLTAASITNQNIPSYNTLKSPQVRLAYNVMGINRTPQEIIGNVAGAIAPPLSVYGGGKVFGVGKQAAAQIGKQTLKQAVKRGAVTGAKIAGSYGAVEGLSSGRTAPNLQTQLLEGVKGGVGGLAVGGLIGGVTSGAGVASGKILSNLSRTYKQLYPQASVKEAEQAAKSFIRDEFGRFAKQGKVKQEPMFYGDLRESLGLPRTTNFQSGAIDFNAKIGKTNSGPVTKKYPTMHEGGITKMVDGEPVKIVDGLETFIHKDENGNWVVSEVSTGRNLTNGGFINRHHAISVAKQNINNAGEDNLKTLISKNRLSSQSLQPNYTPITLNDGKVQKLNPQDNLRQLLAPATQKGESVAETRGRIIGSSTNPKISEVGVQPNQVATDIKSLTGGSQPPSGSPPDILASRIQNPAESPSSSGSVTDFDPYAYIKEQVEKKNKAYGNDVPSSLAAKGKNLLNEIKVKLVDSTSPIEDALSAAEDKHNFKVLPSQDIRLQIDRVLRSKSIASQYAEDNGLVDVIRKAPDLDALNQYMIAKHVQTVAKKGIETGRDVGKDQALVNSLAPEYEPYAQQVTNYSRGLLNYAVDAGLVDRNLAKQLINEYPDYVPLKRVFNVLEEVSNVPSPRGVASVSKQTVVQKLKGSEREIEHPIESLLLKTEDTIHQAERNIAARQLASYSRLPGFAGLMRELGPHEQATHTISFVDNGVKRTFATTKEIADAAKSLNVESIGLIGRVMSVPTRILQAGATGLNIPFVVTNMLKDQVTSFVNSNRAAKTSILNPINFGRALYEALGHGDLYKEVVRNAAGGTSFDIAREAPALTVERVRAGRSVGSKIKYAVKNPTELITALENIIGRSEELGRIQNYSGMKKQLLKEGRTPQDATLLAAQAARENTANFARKGSWGKVLNVTIPFFNAGIQGARQLDRSFQNNSKGTAFKVATTIFAPMAAATLWNTSDSARKQVYDDIDTYEKENNLILIPNGATKDEQGRWNVIKIPIPPGLSNLASLVRRPIEQSAGLDPVSVQEMLANMLTANTSIDVTSPGKLLSSVTPQGLKVPLEAYLNKNLFTGKDIVPRKLQNLPKPEQAYPTTSGTLRMLGKATNTSPLIIENMIRTGAGGVGTQVVNTADRILAAGGAIPQEQIGGESVAGNLERRFRKASGGRIQDKQFEQLQPFKEQAAQETKQRKQVIETIKSDLKNLQPEDRRQYLIDGVKKGTITQTVLNDLVKNVKDEALNRTSFEKSLTTLPVKARARYVLQNIHGKSSDEKKQFLINLYKKKIITNDVLKEMVASRAQ